MHSSSRDSSLTTQHPMGSGSHSSGIQSFPANLVPPGAQGQPYRGQPSQSDSDRERNAPPAGPHEISEEEIAHYNQLMKDHKELSKLIIKLTSPWYKANSAQRRNIKR
jgi:hypothetical protein